MASRGAPSGSYIYLGCLCGLGRLGHEPSELYEHNTSHEIYHDLVNAYTKYPWFLSFDDHNTSPSPYQVRPETYRRERGINASTKNFSEFFFISFLLSFPAMPRKSRNDTQHYIITVGVLLHYSFKIIYAYL